MYYRCKSNYHTITTTMVSPINLTKVMVMTCWILVTKNITSTFPQLSATCVLTEIKANTIKKKCMSFILINFVCVCVCVWCHDCFIVFYFYYACWSYKLTKDNVVFLNLYRLKIKRLKFEKGIHILKINFINILFKFELAFLKNENLLFLCCFEHLHSKFV